MELILEILMEGNSIKVNCLKYYEIQEYEYQYFTGWLRECN